MDDSNDYQASLKSSIRSTMRSRRRMLSATDLQHATRNLGRQLLKSGIFLKSRHLGLYIGNDGELDPAPIIPVMNQIGVNCYLPRIADDNSRAMAFASHRDGQIMQPNRYGILEPSKKTAQRIPAFLLSAVFVPLVAFDENGSRIGMGGGYYDRLFGQNSGMKRPLLIGIAHEFQKVAPLPTEPWDVPLDAVITDHNIYTFKPGIYHKP